MLRMAYSNTVARSNRLPSSRRWSGMVRKISSSDAGMGQPPIRVVAYRFRHFRRRESPTAHQSLEKRTALPPAQTAASSSNAWTDSFQNIQCYDSLKVQATIHEIAGFDHTGAVRTRIPNVLGMNFQAVSVGEKLVEKSISTTGG